jgi:putative PIN family toxin of toxin-antitoxin system
VIRAVIDTNVLVSGLLSPTGNEALILLAIHQGLVHPCFSEEILKEYAAVLARPKFAFPSDEIAAVLAMFRSQGELFLPEASAATSPIRTTPNFCNAHRLLKPISSLLATSAIFQRDCTA